MSESSLRDKLCLAIASLEPDCTNKDAIQSQLDPLFQEAAVAATTPSSEAAVATAGVSPLIVASDQGNVACLQYLASCGYPTLIVGSPTDPSPAEDGGNTAVHHAAVSGCAEAWTIFHGMLMTNHSGSRSSSSSHKNKTDIYLFLGRQTNAHGDTPLQMAVTSGRIEFVQKWYDLCLATCGSNTAKSDTRKTVQRILQTSNQAGDTCASLACCHGHLELLTYLVETCEVALSLEEGKRCQEAVDRTNKAIAFATTQNKEIPAAVHAQHALVQDGLVMIQAALLRQAEAVAHQLLFDDNDTEDNIAPKSGIISELKPAKKSKMKKKKEKPNQRNRNNIQDNSSAPTCNVHQKPQDQNDIFRMTRLEDGRVAVVVPGETAAAGTYIAPSSPVSQGAPAVLHNTTSVDSMFRQRFRGHADSEIDAVMDALCLDVSMLLFTPHGMALNLSPSQLEAVEQILQKQIRSVQEARQLQLRMHHQAAAEKTTNTDNETGASTHA